MEADLREPARRAPHVLPHHSVFPAEGYHIPEEIVYLPIFLEPLPVQPGDAVVLAVGVVVPELRVAEFVPGIEHGRAPAAHQGGEGILHHAATQGLHLHILRLPLHAAVPAIAVVVPVRVVPAVLLIVFHIVGVEVVQGEAVMAGQEVHGRALPPLQRIVHVPGAGDPGDGRPRQAPVPLQEAPHVVPVSAVPFRPSAERRETPHLVEPHRVPGLRNQLHLAQDGIMGNLLDDGRLGHGLAVLVPCQYGGQVEAEPVHPVLCHPVAQAVDDEPAGHRVVAVQRVAAAAEIVIIPVRRQDIIDIIVDPLEGEAGAVVISLRRVVEHHVQDDLDSVLLQLVDQLLQLIPLMVVLHHGGIAGVGGEKAHRVVSPVIIELLPVHQSGVLHLIELKDGHQLHRVHPQVLQIGNLLAQPLKGAPGRHAGGLVLCKSPHMQLIDHQILQGRLQVHDLPPVEVVLHHPGMVFEVLAVLRPLPPVALPCHGLGVGIQQHIVPVEKQPFFPVIRAVQLERVLEFLDFQSEHQHGIGVPNMIGFGELQLRIGLRLLGTEQQQGALRGAQRVNRKADAVPGRRGAVPVVESRPDLEAAYFIQRLQLLAALWFQMYRFHVPSLQPIPVVPGIPGLPFLPGIPFRLTISHDFLFRVRLFPA